MLDELNKGISAFNPKLISFLLDSDNDKSFEFSIIFDGICAPNVVYSFAARLALSVLFLLAYESIDLSKSLLPSVTTI